MKAGHERPDGGPKPGRPQRRISAAAALSGCIVLAALSAPGPAAAAGAVAAPPLQADAVVRQGWDISCGAAALATILTYQQGDPVSERAVIDGLLRHTSLATVERRGGFSMLDLKRFAEDRGYRATGYSGLALSDLVALGPAIVPIRIPHGRHFVVFRGVDGGRVLLSDPAAGPRSMTVAGFEDVWLDHEGFAISRSDIPTARPLPSSESAPSVGPHDAPYAALSTAPDGP
jgi:uncharacterized protein